MQKIFFLFGAIIFAACSAPSTTLTPTTPAQPTRATLTVTAATPVGAAPTITSAHTLVVAHRGGAALKPENTIAAFENALKIGVDMVETDVHLSKDGELVVMHDPDLSRTTDGKGQIGELTLAEIKKLNAAKYARGGVAQQTVPTLGEVLDLIKGRAGIQIEIKLDARNARYVGIEKKVVDAVTARGMLNDVIIISFDFPTLQEIKTIEPRIKTGALVNAAWMSSKILAPPERIIATAIDETGVDYFMPPSNTVFPELVSAVRARGIKIGTWTVNAEPEMRRLIALGVDAITSDTPDELKRVLGR